MLDRKDLVDYLIDRNEIYISSVSYDVQSNRYKIELANVDVAGELLEEWEEKQKEKNESQPFRYKVRMGNTDYLSEYACFEGDTFIGRYSELTQGKDRWKWLGVPTIQPLEASVCNDLIGAVATGVATSGYITTGDNRI